jgi:mono/diheme cytochrome c family protein
MVKLVLAAPVAFLLAITAFASSAPTPSPQGKKADPIKDVYVSNCQMCHGPDGQAPVKEMGFVGRKWKTKTTAEAASVIAKGVPGTVMLAFEGKLTKEQVTALARYVRALDTPAARKKK